MQGVVGSSTNHFIANFLENLPVKKFFKISQGLTELLALLP